MRGLVLEGGGAKGAFHLGAIKALYDNGYTFDGVSGTSIGAINGAIIAQNEGYLPLFNMWTSITPNDITCFDNIMVSKLFNKEIDKETIKYWMKQSLFVLKNYGVPSDKIIPFLQNYIDEEKLRQSKMDFALVTYSVSDMMALELFKEDIPHNKMHEYIFASAYYPAFKMNKLSGKYFIDGGVYDNLPLNALIRRGYTELFAIRTKSKMPQSVVVDSSVKINYICPSEDLGGTTKLSQKAIGYNIKLGYYDTLRFINKYLGNIFYIHSYSIKTCEKLLQNLENDAYISLKTLLNISQDLSNATVIISLFEYIKQLFYDRTNNIEDAFVYFLENYAFAYGMEKFNTYDIKDFYKQLCQKYQANTSLLDNKKRRFLTEKTKQQLIFQEIMKYKGEINE